MYLIHEMPHTSKEKQTWLQKEREGKADDKEFTEERRMHSKNIF